MMSAGLPSDEVVDDYKNSLDDLVANDRISIGNLTVIAKECIEHAQAIARVLENHILRAPPARKLPAFYVLDSIAKNVGTPYTVYFGLNLFHTYMNTFASVDQNVRRKLDEMRKTWSQPVPGSQSTYPVFQKTVTSKIDEAMDNWARKQFSNRGPQIPSRGPIAPFPVQQYHSTPVPPQMQPPVNQNFLPYQQHPNMNGTVHIMNQTQNYGLPLAQNLPQMPLQYSQTPTPVHGQQSYLPQQTPQYGQPPPPYPAPLPVDLDALNRDIDDLIVDAKIGSYSNPMDRASQQKLASLQSLKEIVESGTLSERDLADVRRSISEQLSARLNQRPSPPSIPTPQPPLSYPQQQTPQQGPPPTSTKPSFLNPSNLADLLRATEPRNQPTPPPPSVQLNQAPQVAGVPSNAQNHFASPPAENPIIAQLRASGLFSQGPSPAPLRTNFSSATPVPAPSSTPTHAMLNGTSTAMNVNFTSSSLRTPRPDLLRYLFEARPNRCNTCGRRFTSDEHGRDKKARHLDWHFSTRTRMVEAERRGIQRSWYVDEREWIQSREYDDGNEVDDEDLNGYGRDIEAGAFSSASAAAMGRDTSSRKNRASQKEIFLRVPNDAKLRSEPCPICQEKFESMWSEELQDFIWRDAVQVGPRVYHASCFQEATKDRENNVSTPVMAGGGRAKTATPDSVLGKRKATTQDTDFKPIKVERA